MTLYRLPDYQTSLKSFAISVPEKKSELDFQDGYCGCHLWFPNDFSSFWSTSHPDTFYQVSTKSICSLVQEKKFEIDFQDGGHGHLGIWMGTILPIFDLQVSPLFPTKFRVNWLFGSGEEAQNRFSRWWPSWISNQTIILAWAATMQ